MGGRTKITPSEAISKMEQAVLVGSMHKPSEVANQQSRVEQALAEAQGPL